MRGINVKIWGKILRLSKYMKILLNLLKSEDYFTSKRVVC